MSVDGALGLFFRVVVFIVLVILVLALLDRV